MTELIWDGNCCTCGSPLDILIMSDDDKIFKFLNEHVDMKIFDNNDVKYKFFGKQVRKVCTGCFSNYYEMKKYKNIRNIERGKFPCLKESMSQCDVKTFFDDLEKSWINHGQ